MSYYMVFDTETTGLNKPFCYDVGYVIVNDDNSEIVEAKHFIVEQVWHNLPLFESAYYAEKRPIYVNLLRSRQAFMEKWGYITQQMARDIKKYNIQSAYAYNADFDDKVFTFNCDWFHTKNPFDTVEIFDIWGYSSQFITNNNDYSIFCEKHNRFTEKGNYSGNAETVFQYIYDTDTIEEHIGISDACMELQILEYCFEHGATHDTHYPVTKILPRIIKKPYTIKINGNIIYQGEYLKKYIRNDTYSFTE